MQAAWGNTALNSFESKKSCSVSECSFLGYPFPDIRAIETLKQFLTFELSYSLAQGRDLIGCLFCQAVLRMVFDDELIKLFGVFCRFFTALSREI